MTEPNTKLKEMLCNAIKYQGRIYVFIDDVSESIKRDVNLALEEQAKQIFNEIDVMFVSTEIDYDIGLVEEIDKIKKKWLK